MQLKGSLTGAVLATVLFVETAWPKAFDVGNGGDAVWCDPARGGSYRGFYALDFLATEGIFPEKPAEPVPALDLNASLNRIAALLRRNAPSLAPSFEDFLATLWNTSDFERKRIWEPAPFGLVDLPDENLVAALPPECQASIVQAVVRQNPEFTGARPGKILYKFVPGFMQDLVVTAPVQASFLLVHEWLWDFSDNVDRNRRLNRFLHSRWAETLPPEEFRKVLAEIGIPIDTTATHFVGDERMACVLRSGTPHCWGLFAPKLPPLMDVTDIAAVDSGLCWLRRSGEIACASHAGRLEHEPFFRDDDAWNQGPYQALRGKDSRICAQMADGETWHCRGIGGKVQPRFVQTANAVQVQVSGSGGFFYRNRDGRLSGGAHPLRLLAEVPVGPFDLSDNQLCAAVGARVVCESWNGMGSERTMPAPVQDLWVDANWVCARADDAISCWGSFDTGVEGLKVEGPASVVGFTQLLCIADARGLRCIGPDAQEISGEMPAELRRR